MDIEDFDALPELEMYEDLPPVEEVFMEDIVMEEEMFVEEFTEEMQDEFIEEVYEEFVIETEPEPIQSDIIESEKPISANEPLGQKAQNWIATGMKKIADGSWKLSLSVATSVLTEAAMKYYGLK